MAADSRYAGILVVVRTPPPYGGGEMVGAQLERLLSARYDVLALSRKRHDKARQGRTSVANLLFGARYIAVCCARIARTRPRVLYIDLPKDKPSFLRSSIVLLTAAAFRVRVVGDLAGADIPFLRERSLTARYARWTLRKVHRIRVLGASIASTLRDYGLDRTVVMANGIADPCAGSDQHSEDRSLSSEEPVRLLYVGKVGLSKGALTLVEVMTAASAGGLDWTLDVVGEWESSATRDRVLASVAAAGLEQRITFHGLVVGDAKWAMYRRAHVLLHPTTWDGQPITILEAFAMSVPVVATRVGAIPDTVDHEVDGYLVAPGDVAGLVAGVRYQRRDTESYESARAAARAAFEERFTDTAFARSMSALLEQAAQER
jgi:glycosyltransferase involved in cell wall biosynthesis